MKSKELIAKVKEALETLTAVVTLLEGEEVTSTKNPVETVTVKNGGKKVEAKEEAEDTYTAEELEEMSYNELKSLVSGMGLKAVGKKPDLIKLILGDAGDETDGKVSTPVQKKGSTSTSDKSEKDVEEDGDGTDSDDTEEIDSLIEQISDLELDELKEIAKEAGIPTKGKDKKKIIEALSLAPEKLDKALDALGYYDEEGGDEVALETILANKETEELVEILDNAGLSKKGKKQALVDRILEAVEAGDIEATDIVEGEGEEIVDPEEIEVAPEDEEAEGEWYTEEELKAMTLEELKEIADENEIEVPKKKVKGKMVIDKIALVEALVALGEAEEMEEEFEASDERLEQEATIEKNIKAQYKAKKLKDKEMQKFLADYFEGDAECAGCKGCSAEERLNCYIEIQKNFVDDEGEIHENEDCYFRNGVAYCCGAELEQVDDTWTCTICGTEYDLGDE